MLHELESNLLAIVRQCGRPAVAFSGGVDSAVVAQAAQMAAPGIAIAVTAVSPSLAAGEAAAAKDLAGLIGIRHLVLETNEFAQPGYVRNAGNRCFFCKDELYSQMAARLREWQADVILNGANLDDLGDHRPGLQAAKQHGVRSPLVEAGCDKAAVRELAARWKLPVWDKPAAPCLSSRIAYGVSVTPERVRRVDEAERFLKTTLGLRELRVRLEDHELARIELPVAEIQRLCEPSLRAAVAAKFRELGFRYITLDLEGFRSGSLNAALPILNDFPDNH